jgi:hypothetical protein
MWWSKCKLRIGIAGKMLAIGYVSLLRGFPARLWTLGSRVDVRICDEQDVSATQ